MATMKLHEIIQEKIKVIDQIAEIKINYDRAVNPLNARLKELSIMEQLSSASLDLEKVALSESVMYVRGNPYGKTDDYRGITIAMCAENDIATGCKHLRQEFFGNKSYSGYYQRCDCEYGYGPKHGSISDEIGLKGEARKRDLTDDEMDACIYYLKNFEKIKQAKSKSMTNG